MANETVTKSAKEHMKTAHGLKVEGKFAEAGKYFSLAFELFMSKGMEDEAAGVLVQLAEVSSKLGQVEQAAEYYERSAGIFEKLGKDVATLTSLRATH